VREELATGFPNSLHLTTASVSDKGDTIKFLWSLADGGHPIETVLMHYKERATVCVSTQAGCAMACGFCATGQAGFTRHLTVGEIVEQVVYAARESAKRKQRLANVVFIGIVPGIRKLATRPLPVNLAVSLHAARDVLRDELVPINKRYPINELMQACRDYLDNKNRRISFEWAMIDGINDQPRDARELAQLCGQLTPSAHVNLIPLNPTPGWPTKGTSAAGVRAFAQQLEDLGVNVTVRRNRGTDIDAACGQLAAGQPVKLTNRRGIV
jgi:23S rRNA (adenine2503-C2)-methyltransferase